MRRIRSAMLVTALAAILLQIAPVAAQDAAPNPNATLGDREAPGGERIDLAAMVLSSEFMPEDYGLEFEIYVSGDELADQLTGGVIDASAVAETGLRWYYESRYQSADGQTWIRSYAQEYGSASGARRGFELLEDETLFAGEGRASIDRPGFDVGESPSEVTVSTVDATDTAPSSATVDFTFRVGRLLGGVAIDTVSAVEPDEALIESLAAEQAARMQDVLDGEQVPGNDPSLSLEMVTFDGAASVQEGYVSAIDSIPADAPAAVADGFESGYVRVFALGDPSGEAVPLPVVSVSIGRYEDEGGPLAALTNAQVLTPEYAELERESIERVPATTAAVGFSFANPFADSGIDSFRVMAVVGSNVITIEVQGAPSLDAAREAAIALTAQQAACVSDGITCGPALLPDSLGLPKG